MKISYSMRQATKQCPKKVYWKYFCGIEQRRFKTPSMLIGSAFHLGLETIRRYNDMDLAINTARAALIHSGDFEWENDVAKQENLAKIEVYLLCYESHFFDQMKNWAGIEKEIITETETAYIDGLLIDQHDGAYVIIEDKTRSFPSRDPHLTQKMSDQLLNYCDLLEQIGIQARRCFYRETIKSRLRINSRNPQSELRRKLFEEYSIGDKFVETVITFDKSDIENYKKEKRFYDDYIARLFALGSKDPWPRSSDFCHNAYGHCEFLKLCTGCKNVNEHYKINDKEPHDDGLMRQKLGVTE